MGLECSYPCFVFFLERIRVRRYESWPASCTCMSNRNPERTLDFCVQNDQLLSLWVVGFFTSLLDVQVVFSCFGMCLAVLIVPHENV
jgi:hypothetical protein